MCYNYCIGEQIIMNIIKLIIQLIINYISIKADQINLNNYNHNLTVEQSIVLIIQLVITISNIKLDIEIFNPFYQI